eukprot:scaffold1638_cov258-Pinguiococcus_pyrenoidosus.AAC.80
MSPEVLQVLLTRYGLPCAAPPARSTEFTAGDLLPLRSHQTATSSARGSAGIPSISGPFLFLARAMHNPSSLFRLTPPRLRCAVAPDPRSRVSRDPSRGERQRRRDHGEAYTLARRQSADPHHAVQLQGLSGSEMRILDLFEDADYERAMVSVQLVDTEEDTEALTYLFAPNDPVLQGAARCAESSGASFSRSSRARACRRAPSRDLVVRGSLSSASRRVRADVPAIHAG